MVDIIDIDYLASSSAHTYKIYKPPKSSKKRSTKSDEVVSLMASDDAYEQYIKRLNEMFTKNEETVFVKLAGQLVEYVERINSIYTSESPIAFQNTQCAIVTMSVNITELGSLYSLIFSKIEEFTSSQIVVNSEKVKCITDFVKIIQENLNSYLDLPDGEIPLCFYSLTADFCNNNFNPKQPMAIFFEDFDCFHPNLLTDLLMVIHENLEKMPLILIFFQSTDTLPLNMRLPSKATNNLAVENFSIQSTEKFFCDLIKEICWDTNANFRLGPATISHLTDVYKLWDTSLSGGFRRVKQCVFEHFYNKRYAKLCCPDKEFDKVIADLDDEDLMILRNLPSLKNHHVPKDNEKFRANLKMDLQKFCDYFFGIQHELKFYHHLKILVNADETFTFLMSTWIIFLNPSETITESEDFWHFSDEFLKLDQLQIIQIMDKVSKVEESKSSDIYKALKNHFSDFTTKIKNESLPIDFKENKPSDPQKRTRGSNGIRSPIKTAMSRVSFLNELQKKGKKTNEKLKKWREDFLNILKEELDKIKNPLTLPYHEVFFFEDVDEVEQFSLPTVRNDILTALKSPEKILHCKCCVGLGPKSPDMTITYAIYCDNLRVANLAKCFNIFKQLIVQPSSTRVSPRKKAKKDTQKLDENQALSRFIKSIEDLEYLGLLRAHPRKVDHIERLVWTVENHPNIDSDDELPPSSELDEKMGQMSLNLN